MRIVLFLPGGCNLAVGNGSYKITGVASGITTGEDPWTVHPVLPLAEGASLVVIYTKSSYPTTRVYLWEGAEYSDSSVNPLTSWLVPIPALSDPVGLVRTTAIVADGQTNSMKDSHLECGGQSCFGV